MILENSSNIGLSPCGFLVCIASVDLLEDD
jgi:hypothetical protein